MFASDLKKARLILPVSQEQNKVMKNSTWHSEIKHGFYML